MELCCCWSPKLMNCNWMGWVFYEAKFLWWKVSRILQCSNFNGIWSFVWMKSRECYYSRFLWLTEEEKSLLPAWSVETLTKKKHHPTSHIKLLWAPSRRSSCLTTWPSYGPIHVPGGMGWAAQTPNSAPGTLDLQSLTSSGNIKEGHCGKHRFFFRSVQSERIKITQMTAPMSGFAHMH